MKDHFVLQCYLILIMLLILVIDTHNLVVAHSWTTILLVGVQRNKTVWLCLVLNLNMLQWLNQQSLDCTSRTCWKKSNWQLVTSTCVVITCRLGLFLLTRQYIKRLSPLMWNITSYEVLFQGNVLIADILTKALDSTIFLNLLALITSTVITKSTNV